MPTVASLKDGQGWQPLLLAFFTFQAAGPPTLLVSTHPFDGVAGPSFPGIGILPPGNYIGRIAQQDIDALQQRSQLGTDRIAKVALHLWDDDHFLWKNYCIFSDGSAKYGFRGATVQLALVMWQAGTTNFSSDAPIQFVGTCDMEILQQGGSVLSVFANNSHNTATVKLPLFPIQNRCPKLFPTNAAQRLLAATDPTSPYYPCGYGPDQGGYGNTGPANHTNAYGDVVTDGAGFFVSCDFTRSNGADATVGCMARLGNRATTSVAPDGDLMHDTSGRRTGAFAGVQWNPGTYYAIVKNYTSQSKIPAFSFLNQAVLGQYQNLLFGTQFVSAKLANVIESGNDTKMEAMICTGDIGTGGVLIVVVNGVELNKFSGPFSVDGSLGWKFGNVGGMEATGGRQGAATQELGYNLRHGNTLVNSALGDPYGSIAMIEVVVYKDIFTGFGVPTVQVLASGPELWEYLPILNISGGVVTFANNLPNGDCAGNPPYTVTIFGNTLSAANANWQLSSWSAGPPGTIILIGGPGGSGTGGYVRYQTGVNTSAGSIEKSNPAWVVLNILLMSNWQDTEFDLGTFSAAAVFCDAPISYVNAAGQTATHPRFKCQFSLEQRKTAAEVIAAVLRCFNGYLAWGPNGLLQLFINQTLADSQPVAITGSNYNTAVTSVHADGSAGTGHVAYSFEESNVARIGQGDNERPDLEFEQNATVMTPNEIYIQFQDEDNQFVLDSIGEIDAEAVARAGGALQPGGSLIPETLIVLGISNFDQAARIANVYMAERQRGNPANDPRGTITIKFGTTVRCEHLRVGHLVFFSWQALFIQRQLFRVIKISPSTDYQTARITISWVNEVWYEDLYGQAPQAFFNGTNTNRPARAPHPWQPFGEQPNSTIFDATEWNFHIAELDTVQQNGLLLVQLKIGGNLPIDQPNSAALPPLAPVQATTSNTGGSIPGGVRLFIQICGVDVNGNLSAASGTILAVIPAGTDTNTVTISNLGWSSQTAGYQLFAGYDHFSITHQQSATLGIGSMPTSITVSDLPNKLAYGPPDLAAASVLLQAKLIIHSGIIGTIVESLTSTTITLGEQPASPLRNDLTDYKVMLIGRPGLNGGNLPIIDFTVSSNASYVLTVDRDPTGLLFVGDVITVCAQANIASSTTIGDANFVSAYGPAGVGPEDASLLVRIIAGKGRYQIRTIASVSGDGTTYTLTRPWSTIPDATSRFIVEESTWPYGSPSTQINVSNLSDQPVSYLNIDNYPGKPLLVMPILVDATGNLSANEHRSPFRIIWTFGAQGERALSIDSTQLRTDGLVTYDASGGNRTYTLLPKDQVPNQTLVVQKIPGDGNTVSIVVAPLSGDTFLDGSTVITLSDGPGTNVSMLKFNG